MQENPVDEGIKEIEEWLAKTGMKESRLGNLACANARAIPNIRTKGATLKNFERVIAYIRANPDGEKDG